MIKLNDYKELMEYLVKQGYSELDAKQIIESSINLARAGDIDG